MIKNYNKVPLASKILSVLAVSLGSISLSGCNPNPTETAASTKVFGPIAKGNCDKGKVMNLSESNASDDQLTQEEKIIKQTSQISCEAAVKLGDAVVNLYNKNTKSNNFNNSYDGSDYVFEYNNPNSGVYAEVDYTAKNKNGRVTLIHVQSAMVGTKKGKLEGDISFDNSPTRNTWASYANGNFNGVKYPGLDTYQNFTNPGVNVLAFYEIIDSVLEQRALNVINKEN